MVKILLSVLLLCYPLIILPAVTDKCQDVSLRTDTGELTVNVIFTGYPLPAELIFILHRTAVAKVKTVF
ncbi:hypothetical protein CKG00_00955 [Morganella morganii]|uniref:Uncharacterized protein n=1 Tax=Morganella morganii TaxID=582 RepID=A0A433ZSN9_MORMO|nr:hypothetical protein CKG00_00955 [Morganella morganii]